MASVANEVCACRGLREPGGADTWRGGEDRERGGAGGIGEEGQPRGQAVITHGKSLWSAVRLDWEKAGGRLRKWRKIFSGTVSFEMTSFVP